MAVYQTDRYRCLAVLVNSCRTPRHLVDDE